MSSEAGGVGPPRYAGATDVGHVRTNNEDSYLVAPPLFAVADGMGGHRAGEVASSGAIKALQEEVGDDTDSLVAAVHAANRAVHAQATANPDLAGMGTTITAMMVTADGAQIVHVGDSRAYRLRDGRLERLTQDHTVVDRLAREGKIPPEEVERHPQRSVLERALGVGPEVDVDVRIIDVHAGDRILLCTDGLTSMLEDEEIRTILQQERDPAVSAGRLVEGALDAGGKDNVTALVVDFPRPVMDGPDPAKTAEQPVLTFGSDLGQSPSVGRSRRRPIGGAVPAAGTAVAEGAGGHRGGTVVTGAEPTLGPSPQPGRSWRPPGTKLLIGAAVIVPLLAIGVVAALVAVRGSWYVGQKGGKVAVFRGVPGSFAGIKLSSLAIATDIETASLPSVYQRRLRDGITASGRRNAIQTAQNLRQYLVPPQVSATVSGTVTTTVEASPAASASPAGSPRGPSP